MEARKLDPKDAAPAAPRLDQRESARWKERAARRVPVMSQTFSKAPMSFPQGSHPAFLASGDGCRVKDVDGNEYIDFVLGLGPVVLGYRNPAVDRAIREQLESGISFSMAHPLEVEVAELLAECVPCAEMSRFSKTGSEVTAAAVRAARAYTGRDMIAHGSYHGWHDWYAAQMQPPRDVGVPASAKELLVPFNFNDLASLQAAFDAHPGRIAAAILEPQTLDDPAPGYLDELIALCHRRGALVIFDEIVSGFRIATGGAQERYKVVPDLATFGKGMANGAALAAVVGKGEVMRKFEDAFFSTTFGGETLALAAAKAAITEFRRLDVSKHLWAIGERIQAAFDKGCKAAGVNGRIWGPGPHFLMLVHDNDGVQTPHVKSLFLQECVRRGLLLHWGAINICLAHGDAEVAHAERAMGEALAVVGQALRDGAVEQRLDGEPYTEVFRRNR